MTDASANHGSDTVATRAADPHASFRFSIKAYPAKPVAPATIGADGDVAGTQPPRQPAPQPVPTTGWDNPLLRD